MSKQPAPVSSAAIVLLLLGCLCSPSKAQTAENKNVLSQTQLFKFDQKQHERLTAEESATPGDTAIRMSTLYVFERPVKVREHEILTPASRVAIAKKRYLSPVYQKTFGPLAAIPGFLANPLGGFMPNAPEAMLLYEQDEQLRRNREMGDLIALDNFRPTSRGLATSVVSPETNLKAFNTPKKTSLKD